MLRRWCKRYLLVPLSALLYALLSRSWRISYHGTEGFLRSQRATEEGVLLALWHGDIPILLHLVSRHRLVTMVSMSRDGEWISQVIALLGGATVRGSSSRRGGLALRQLLRFLRHGRIAALALDGPTGPRHVIKPGVWMLARASGACIVPVGVASERGWRFEQAWDKSLLPHPFARISVVFGAPWRVNKKRSESGIDDNKQLFAELLAAKERAEQGLSQR